MCGEHFRHMETADVKGLKTLQSSTRNSKSCMPSMISTLKCSRRSTKKNGVPAGTPFQLKVAFRCSNEAINT